MGEMLSAYDHFPHADQLGLSSETSPMTASIEREIKKKLNFEALKITKKCYLVNPKKFHWV